MLYLLRDRILAVAHYSGVSRALHLQHDRQSLNSGQDMQGRHANNIYLFPDSIIHGMDSVSSAE